MKTISSILTPAFYEQVYNQLCEYEHIPEDEDDCYGTAFMTIDTEFGEVQLTVNAKFQIYWEDESFDHAFGTEVLGGWASGDFSEIEIEEFYFDDDETNYADEFDTKYFWDMHKVYGTQSQGVQIKNGDQVVAYTKGRNAVWRKVTFLYYDRHLGAFICRDRAYGRREYRRVLPVTPENENLIRKQYRR